MDINGKARGIMDWDTLFLIWRCVFTLHMHPTDGFLCSCYAHQTVLMFRILSFVFSVEPPVLKSTKETLYNFLGQKTMACCAHYFLYIRWQTSCYLSDAMFVCFVSCWLMVVELSQHRVRWHRPKPSAGCTGTWQGKEGGLSLLQQLLHAC